MLERDADGADLAQREQLGAWEAALAACGLPVAGLDAPRARPRFALAAPLAAGIAGEAELADTWLVERLPVWRVRGALEGRIPAGWRLRDLYDVWLGEPALPGQVAASVYRATFSPGAVDATALDRAAAALLEAETLPRERQKGERQIVYDLRPFLGQLDVEAAAAGSGPVVLRLTLQHDSEKGVGRPVEALAALGGLVGRDLVPATLARESLLLADPPPRQPAASRRRGPGPVAR